MLVREGGRLEDRKTGRRQRQQQLLCRMGIRESRESICICRNTYIVIPPQTKHNLTMHIPALQPSVQKIVRGPEHGRQDVRGGKDLLYPYTNTINIHSFASSLHSFHLFSRQQAKSDLSKRERFLRTTLASMRAYSKSGLPCSSCSRRKGAFWRLV